MNNMVIIGMLMVASLAGCQQSSGGKASNPIEKSDKKTEGSKNGGADSGSEIAIVNLTDDLGECNSERKGKTYYVLVDKKFRYCSAGGQWDEVDIKGSAGKSSLVSVTAETAGANCASGGQKIQSGKDSDDNGTLDASEVTSTSFACNGQAGSSGAAGSNGKPSLVGVTSETAGANCANGGHRVRSGLDTNGNSVLDDSEVQATSYVCHGATGSQGTIGATGASGKNSLIKLSAESAGVNCSFGGRKLEVGTDTDNSGVLDASEVSQSSYVCDGSSLKLKKSDGSVIGQVISIFALPRMDVGTQRQTSTMIFLVKSSATNAYAAYLGARSSLIASPWSGLAYVPSLDSAASPDTLKLLDISFWGQTTFYANYNQLHYMTSDCSGQAYIVRTYSSTYQPDGDVLLFGSLPSFSLRYSASSLITMNKTAETWSTRSFSSFGTASSCSTVSTSQTSSPVQVVATTASEWPLTVSSGWTIAP